MVPRLCSGRLRAHGSAGVLGEYDGSDNLLRKFIYGPGIDEPICIIDVGDSNAVYHYHFDGLGSVVALSDVNNVIVESYSYDVFGAPTIYDANQTEISASAIGNPYMFTARRADDETALYYYRARYYAFDIGRFLQTDPVGYYGGLNMYTYCGNNPVAYVDPLGTQAISPYAEGGVIYEPSGSYRYFPPNASQQNQINNLYQTMKNTGNPKFQIIAERLEQREIIVDIYLPEPTGTEEGTGAYVHPYTNPNTIYVNPLLFSEAPPITSGNQANFELMEYLIHEDLHLVSRYDVTDSEGWINGFLAGIIGYNDGIDEPYGSSKATVGEVYTHQLWLEIWDIMLKSANKKSSK